MFRLTISSPRVNEAFLDKESSLKQEFLKKGLSFPPKEILLISYKAEGELQIGQRVAHKKFGEGVVLRYEGQGGRARVQVNFAQVGSKWLMPGYANLEPLD